MPIVSKRPAAAKEATLQLPQNILFTRPMGRFAPTDPADIQKRREAIAGKAGSQVSELRGYIIRQLDKALALITTPRALKAAGPLHSTSDTHPYCAFLDNIVDDTDDILQHAVRLAEGGEFNAEVAHGYASEEHALFIAVRFALERACAVTSAPPIKHQCDFVSRETRKVLIERRIRIAWQLCKTFQRAFGPGALPQQASDTYRKREEAEKNP